KRVSKISTGEEGELTFDRTPFYGESGGQVGDTGFVTSSSSRAQILDTQRPVQGLIAHKAKVLEGAFTVGEKVELIVDAERRAGLRRNHSATHLLHRALREILGEGVKQAGSVVAPDYLRFDYTAYQPLTDEQRTQLERRVNQLVYEDHEAPTRVMDPEAAGTAGAAAALKTAPRDVALRAEQAANRIKELERELEQLQRKQAAAKSSELAQTAREVRGVKVLAARHESGDPEAMRELADKLRDQLKSGIVVLGGEKDGKATLLVAVTSDLSRKYPAGNLVKELSKTLGGRGGGKAELAQAGGGDPAQLDAALARAYELVGP